MSATDTRSIGQVLYETLYTKPAHGTWLALNSCRQLEFERAAEIIFKRGHDARGREEKVLTPKAKQYRDEAVSARADLANLRAEALASWHRTEGLLSAIADIRSDLAPWRDACLSVVREAIGRWTP